MDRGTTTDIGALLTRGALRTLAYAAALLFAVAFLLGLARDVFGVGYDGSDDIPGGRRSGLQVRTDYATGCQYLESSQGGVTPRYGRDGKQVCR